MGKSGYRHEPDGPAVTAGEAYEAWAAEAYSVLVDVARSYHAVITYKELSEQVQERSGIHTSALLHNWIGKILAKVVREAHRRGDPPLTALVVHSDDGMVGEGYKEVLEVAGEPPVEDAIERERHAAAGRLACYRRFGAVLPADGGLPALAPKLQERLGRQRSREGGSPERICPECFVQLPTTGICDSCG